jgi:hypothetical protein
MVDVYVWGRDQSTDEAPMILSNGRALMPHYPAIRSFLSNHHGYYCEECLATRLNLSLNEIRRSVG